MTAPDAYLVEFRNGDVEILDPGDRPGATDFVDAEPLEMLWSVDHGLRCGDETIGVIVVNTAAEIMFPLLNWLWIDTHRVDTWQAMADEIGAPTWEGGWIDDEDMPGDRWDAVEALNDLQDRMESAAADVGLIVESNGDCGMTWCYRRLSA
jgi:hypothetical protein